MGIFIDDLVVDFDHLDPSVLLQSWNWLVEPGNLPIMVTAMGDVFTRNTRDGSVHFLSVGAAAHCPIASDMTEFRGLLADEEFVRYYFDVKTITVLEEAGVKLGQKQLYGLEVPPVLGGKYELPNVLPTDILVHFTVTGQIHRQVKDLPPGTKITGFEIL